jgi:hypothetical protein
MERNSYKQQHECILNEFRENEFPQNIIKIKLTNDTKLKKLSTF